ncbi:MAG: hypothetical protein ACRYG7_49825 [Janthinobacterium lividum]
MAAFLSRRARPASLVSKKSSPLLDWLIFGGGLGLLATGIWLLVRVGGWLAILGGSVLVLLGAAMSALAVFAYLLVRSLRKPFH